MAPRFLTTNLNNTNISAHLENFENKTGPFANSYAEIVHITKLIEENKIISPVSDIYDYARLNSLFALIMIYLTNNTLADDIPGEICSVTDNTFKLYIKKVEGSYLTRFQIRKIDYLIDNLKTIIPSRLIYAAEIMIKIELKQKLGFKPKKELFASSYAEIIFNIYNKTSETCMDIYKYAGQNALFALIMIYIKNGKLADDVPDEICSLDDPIFLEYIEKVKKSSLTKPQILKLDNLLKNLIGFSPENLLPSAEIIIERELNF